MSHQIYFYAIGADLPLFRGLALDASLTPIRIENLSTSFYSPDLFENPFLVNLNGYRPYQFTHSKLLSETYFSTPPHVGGYHSMDVPCLEAMFGGFANGKLRQSRCYFSKEGCPDSYSLDLLSPLVSKFYRTLRSRWPNPARRIYFAPEAFRSWKAGEIELDCIL